MRWAAVRPPQTPGTASGCGMETSGRSRSPAAPGRGGDGRPLGAAPRRDLTSEPSATSLPATAETRPWSSRGNRAASTAVHPPPRRPAGCPVRSFPGRTPAGFPWPLSWGLKEEWWQDSGAVAVPPPAPVPFPLRHLCCSKGLTCWSDSDSPRGCRAPGHHALLRPRLLCVHVPSSWAQRPQGCM